MPLNIVSPGPLHAANFATCSHVLAHQSYRSVERSESRCRICGLHVVGYND